MSLTICHFFFHHCFFERFHHSSVLLKIHLLVWDSRTPSSVYTHFPDESWCGTQYRSYSVTRFYVVRVDLFFWIFPLHFPCDITYVRWCFNITTVSVSNVFCHSRAGPSRKTATFRHLFHPTDNYIYFYRPVYEAYFLHLFQIPESAHGGGV